MSNELTNEVKANPANHADHIDQKEAGALSKFASAVWSKSEPTHFLTKEIGSATSLVEIKLYSPEDDYAKTHLTKLEYDQFEKENSLLYKFGYYLTGKDAKDEYPMHDRVKHEMAEEAKHNLNKDDEVAGAMFKNDPGKFKEYQKERAEIEKFKKDHPHEDLDINKYPQHKLVEEVIAATKPTLILNEPFQFERMPDIRLQLMHQDLLK